MLLSISKCLLLTYKCYIYIYIHTHIAFIYTHMPLCIFIFLVAVVVDHSVPAVPVVQRRLRPVLVAHKVLRTELCYCYVSIVWFDCFVGF